MQHEEAKIESLGGGAILERGNLALEKIWQNINDPNTLPEEKREVIIKIAVKPNQMRDKAHYEIKIQTKLAEIAPFGDNVYIHRVNGQTTALDGYVEQPEITGFDNAYSINKNKEGTNDD